MSDLYREGKTHCYACGRVVKVSVKGKHYKHDMPKRRIGIPGMRAVPIRCSASQKDACACDTDSGCTVHYKGER